MEPLPALQQLSMEPLNLEPLPCALEPRPLHFELIAASPIDIRDAPLLAMTCKAAHLAFKTGRLQLFTSPERIFTTVDEDRLYSLLPEWKNVVVLNLERV